MKPGNWGQQKRPKTVEKIYNLVPGIQSQSHMLCVLSAVCVKICLVYIYIDWPVAMESEYFNFSPFIAHLSSTIKHGFEFLQEILNL